MSFILPRNPVLRMASRAYGLFRPLPFLMVSLARRKGVMSRTTLLVLLAAIIGYSANRFDVLENFVPVMKSVGMEATSTANAFSAYLFSDEYSPAHAAAWIGTVVTMCLILAWGVFGVQQTYYEKQAFPGGFKILADEDDWRLWAVIFVTLLLPLEAVARLAHIVLIAVLVPCVLVGRYAVRVLNFDLSKLRKTSSRPNFPAEPPAPPDHGAPQSLRSHWDPPTELTTGGLGVTTTGGLEVTTLSDSGPTITGGGESVTGRYENS